jgi:hypothetical protein
MPNIKDENNQTIHSAFNNTPINGILKSQGTISANTVKGVSDYRKSMLEREASMGLWKGGESNPNGPTVNSVVSASVGFKKDAQIAGTAAMMATSICTKKIRFGTTKMTWRCATFAKGAAAIGFARMRGSIQKKR